MRFTLPVLAMAAGLALAAPAKAQVVIPPQPFVDMVSMSLSAEDWVKTETALVTLVVDAAGTSEQSSNLRADIVKVAGAVAEKADWRIVRLDSRRDETGLERWQAEVQARLPEPQLAGLTEKAKKASRPGLQVTVGQVRFEPTLAEIEAAKGKLRAEIYTRVNEELKRLEQAFPDRDYRVSTVDFFDPEMFPQPMHEPRMMAAESMAKADVQSGVQDKLRITARIMLGAFALPPTQP